MSIAKRIAVTRFCDETFYPYKKIETDTHIRYIVDKWDYAIYWKSDASVTFRGFGWVVEKHKYENIINKLKYGTVINDLPF